MKTSPANRATIRALLADAKRVLAAGPHPEKAERDAQELLLLALRGDVPGAARAWLITHDGERVSADVAEAMATLVERRLTGEPMQYISGEAEFYGMRLGVNREVLIPRPETELAVEKALGFAKDLGAPRILEVGTGSGAIALALKHQRPGAVVTATEISEAALGVARDNAKRLGLRDRIRFLKGDLLEPVAGELFDIVVSNPPYVAERDHGSLAVEVREFEPAQALFAGADGLNVYRRLIPAAFAGIVSGGFVVLEIGFGQANAVQALLGDAGFTGIEFTADLQGIPRVAVSRRL